MTDENDPPESLIPYDEHVQEALRDVVRRVLKSVQGSGLPGGHHFYISFRTTAPGVNIPKPLLAQYPDEMTIVLQNQYWDLDVGDAAFSVGLSFNKVASTLTIPYAALTGFADPSVNFGLQFPGGDLFDAEDDDGGDEMPFDEDAEVSRADGATASDNVVVSLDQFRKKSPNA